MTQHETPEGSTLTHEAALRKAHLATGLLAALKKNTDFLSAFMGRECDIDGETLAVIKSARAVIAEAESK